LTAKGIEEAILEFRTWAQNFNRLPEPCNSPSEQIDLTTLVGHFIALRQDIQLQTKSTRSVVEQNAEILKQLTQVVSDSGKSQGREDEEAVKTLLKVLIDTYDALAMSQKQVEKGRQNLQKLIHQMEFENPVASLPPQTEAIPIFEPSGGFWSRLFGFRKIPTENPFATERLQLDKWREQQLQFQAEKREQNRLLLDMIQQTVDGLLTGYSMSLSRIDKVLPQFELESMTVLGERFDPERMEVLEIVFESGRPIGTVIEEVRRGYWYRGAIFRYAQVRIAK
jgi:molecular chaperone GrpE